MLLVCRVQNAVPPGSPGWDFSGFPQLPIKFPKAKMHQATNPRITFAKANFANAEFAEAECA